MTVTKELEPPTAKRIPVAHTLHGKTRVDPYAWMRDREGDPDVIAYLEAENAYTDAVIEPLTGAKDAIYEEILGRIKQTDLSVPYTHGPYQYYARTEEGLDYPIYCRKLAAPGEGAEEEVVLDVNALAEGHEYCRVGIMEVSPNHELLAYSLDTSGDERYTLHVMDLGTRELIDGPIADVSYSMGWANDEVFFYVTVDQAFRPYKAFRHVLGAPVAHDALIHHEEDDAFFMGIGRSRSGRYIVLSMGSKVTSESRVLGVDDPMGAFRVVEPRSHGVEYDVTHHGDHFYVTTNADGAVNFKLMRASVDELGREQWEEVLGHRDDVHLRYASSFAGHLVLAERTAALGRIRVMKMEDGEPGAQHVIDFDEPIYSAGLGTNEEYDTTTIRLGYASLVTPSSVYDYDMVSRETTLLKRQEVYHYDPGDYVSERVWVTAEDGAEVPVSLVYKKGARDAGPAPMYLMGYGSYGYTIDPYFSAARVSLLDRGVIFGIAHVRGSTAMGRPWYDAGKMLNKRNTFTDFVAVAQHLVDAGYTVSERLAIQGGSAGGLLMGAVTNLRPDLFGVVVASVPFVDVLNTILDETLPLTVTEWEEWGNPNDAEYYDYIASYAPYENVAETDYPAMFVSAGLNDPRVSYWEPAKWVARLRHRRTDANTTVLRTNMGAGHSGASGRYGRFGEIAEEFAFVLHHIGALD